MSEGTTIRALIDAAARDGALARRLLADRPALLNERYLNGETALHFLAVEGCVEGVRLLAEAGADVNATNSFGDTALIDVAVLGNAEVAVALLQHGADPNAASATRDNPVHAAAGLGHVAVLDALLAAGGRVDYVTDLGETVWDAIAQRPKQRDRMESVLSKHGARRPTSA